MKKLAHFFLCLSLLLTGCGVDSQSKLISDCHASIEQMLAIQKQAQEPIETDPTYRFLREIQEGGPRKPDWFDVNSFFAALPHIEMEEGYTLDYVQFKGSNGSPIIFARKIGEPFYPTFDEMNEERLIALHKISDDPDMTHEEQDKAYRDYEYRYMDHIKVDDNSQGFLEFVIFRILGDQFYLMWHANYHDQRPICTYSDLERAIADAISEYEFLSGDLDGVLTQAKDIDLSPSVTFEDELVIVKLLLFTKFGGVIQTETTIKRGFPHNVIEEKFETIIEYNTGMRF